MPYIPGCTQERPPPLVLTASLPPGAIGAALHERAPLAFGAKAQIFQEQDRVDGERVIQHGQPDIAMRQPGHRVGARTALGGRGDREVRHAT